MISNQFDVHKISDDNLWLCAVCALGGQPTFESARTSAQTHKNDGKKINYYIMQLKTECRK